MLPQPRPVVWLFESPVHRIGRNRLAAVEGCRLPEVEPVVAAAIARSTRARLQVLALYAVPHSYRPVFIGGINRSGTSMVRQILGSHPDLAMPPSEFEFFKRLTLPTGWAPRSDEVLDTVAEILKWPKVKAWNVDPDLVRRYALRERSGRGIFVAFLRAYAAKVRKPRFGEKTTHYERHLATFDRWFASDYTFVHLLRHPVPTFASNRWYGGVEHRVDARAWALEWCRSALTAVRAPRTRRTYLAVRYEDIVRAPEQQTRLMCQVAGLSFEAEMLSMADFDQKDNSSFELGSTQYVAAIRRDNIDRASYIPGDQLAIVRSRCRSSAALVGYDVDDEHLLLPFPLVHGRTRAWSARASIGAATAAGLALSVPRRIAATVRIGLR